jgi:hypothetical protein
MNRTAPAGISAATCRAAPGAASGAGRPGYARRQTVATWLSISEGEHGSLPGLPGFGGAASEGRHGFIAVPA